MNACFQALPDHVVGLIYNYVMTSAFNSNLAQDRQASKDWAFSKKKKSYNNLNVAEQNTTQLLSLCRSWRNAVLSDILYKTEIDWQQLENKVEFKRTNWPRHLESSPTHIVAHYTRHLAIYLDFANILDGSALKQLYDLVGPCFFSKTWSLELCLSYVSAQVDFDYSYKNIQVFVNHLLAVIPNANAVSLDMKIYSRGISDSEKMLISKFISAVLSRANKVKYRNNYTINDICIAFPGTSPLTYLEFNWDKNFIQFVQIIHKNHACLAGLKITTVVTEELKNIFYSADDGSQITYFSMRKFSLSSTVYDQTSDNNNIVLSYAPFPQLTTLVLDCEFPFSDDTIFDSCTTLKTANLWINKKSILRILGYKNSNVDSPFADLLNVNLTKELDFAHTNDDFQEAILFISQAKQSVRHLALMEYTNAILDSEKILFSHIYQCQNLATLMIPSINLDIEKTLFLLSKLSQLKTLKSRPNCLDPLFETVSEADLPDYVYTHFRSPTPHRQINWIIQTNPYMFYKRVSKAILLLKIAHPRLDFLATNPSYAENYLIGINECMQMAHYAKHFCSTVAGTNFSRLTICD